MKIGIIGTGNIGGTLARKLSAAGHEVLLTNSRGREGARSLASEIGATPVELEDAVTGVDAVILSIPFAAISSLPTTLFDGLPPGVPLIDTGNSYPDMRDPHVKAIDDGMVESLWGPATPWRPPSVATPRDGGMP